MSSRRLVTGFFPAVFIALAILLWVYPPAAAAADVRAVAIGYAEWIAKMVVPLGRATQEEADRALAETVAALPADGIDPVILDELRALHRDLAEEVIGRIERESGADVAQPLREAFELNVLLDRPTENVIATALSHLKGGGGTTALQRLTSRTSEPTAGDEVSLAQPGSSSDVLEAASVAEPAVGASAAASLACDVSGTWRMTTDGIGESIWTFAMTERDRFSGQEQGLGYATGTAVLNVNVLELQWQTGEYSGLVRLTLDPSCASANGEHIFYTGREGAFPTRWRRIEDAALESAGGDAESSRAAPGGSGDPKSVTQRANGAADQCNFAGTWTDNFGLIITLMQSGDAVSGSYVHQGTNATIEAMVAGPVLTGTWKQEPHHGDMTLTLTDCNTWSGPYTNVVSGNGGTWSATRVAAGPAEAAPADLASAPTNGGNGPEAPSNVAVADGAAPAHDAAVSGAEALDSISAEEPLLGSWQGCDGRIVEFTAEGDRLVGRYTALGGLGAAGFTLGEIGYVATPSGSARYEAQVQHRSIGGASAVWHSGTISVAGDQYTDNASDSCSQTMARIAPGRAGTPATELMDAAAEEASSGRPECNFAGTWRDNFGTTVTVTQTGTAVEGSYEYQGVGGTINGTAAGAVLTGSYRQPGSSDPQWRSGSITFTLTDCDAWSGTYTNSAGVGMQGWNATRLAAAPTGTTGAGEAEEAYTPSTAARSDTPTSEPTSRGNGASAPQAVAAGDPLLGSWQGCDGRVAEFTAEGDEIIGRYTSLGGLGGFGGFSIGEIGYRHRPTGGSRYEGQDLWRFGDGRTEWKPSTIILAGDAFSDTGADACSQTMSRVKAAGEPGTASAAAPGPPTSTVAAVGGSQAGGHESDKVLPAGTPGRIILQGDDGSRRIIADLRRTGIGEWEWSEGDLTFRFQAISETGSELLIHDASRDIYHHLVLTTGQTFWRAGTAGVWNPHYPIVATDGLVARPQK